MTIDKKRLIKIKVDFESGKLSKTSICKKNKITRPTLRKHAREGEWIYQKNFQKISKIVENRVIEKMVEENTDILGTETEKYLHDSKNIRGVAMSLLNSMAKMLIETKGHLSAAEANRLLSCQRVAETTMKTITGLYNATRKAFGLDEQKANNVIIGDININDAKVVKDVFDKITE